MRFNEWLNKKFNGSHRQSLLAYPEGHRMAGTVRVEREKLKTGMIKYAYREGIAVQLLMSFGNEEIFNEKRLSMGWGKEIYYSFGDVIEPGRFETEREFVEFIKDEFCRYFDEVYEVYLVRGNGRAEEEIPLRNAE